MRYKKSLYKHETYYLEFGCLSVNSLVHMATPYQPVTYGYAP